MYKTEPVSLENVQMGRLLEKANEALGRMAHDVIDRAGNPQPRKLTVTIEIKPGEQDGEVIMPELVWNVKLALPPDSGITTRGIVEDGAIHVNVHDPDPRQTVLLEYPRWKTEEEGVDD